MSLRAPLSTSEIPCAIIRLARPPQNYYPYSVLGSRPADRIQPYPFAQNLRYDLGMEKEIATVLRKRGRTTTFDPLIAEEICDRMSEGENLAAICRDDHMPALRTAYEWRDAQPDFAARFARARSIGHDAMAERLRAVAAGEKGASSGDPVRDKLILDTDRWLLARWSPQKYADRVDMTHSNSDGTPLKTVHEIVFVDAPAGMKQIAPKDE